MERIESYCIITPAFNEAAYIKETIQSVLYQSVLPGIWIIVDDGSIDNTPAIIKKYAGKYDFIRYHYRERPDGQEYFASNVFAIMEGYEQIKQIAFDYLAILDADIRLPEDYYERILNRFRADDKLGIASGIYENLIDGKLHKVLNDRRSTPKAIQVFRREVFERIGGFLPLQFGGEDTIACVMARMNGWKAWSFPDIKVVHLRPTGTGAVNNILSVRFRQGICEYNLAAHPLFFLLKAVRRALLEKPYIFGGLARMAGYLWAALRRDKTVLPPEVTKFIRQEHLRRVFRRNKVEGNS